jgi:hypothetical protein
MKTVRAASIKLGTIVVVRDQVCIIDEVSPTRPKNPYAYKCKTSHRGYICGLEEIQAVLGQGDLDAFNGVSTAPPPVRKVPTDSTAIFGILQGVKPGTMIQIRGRGGKELVEYSGWNRNRPKYPVSFTRNGRPMKCSEDTVVGVQQDDGKVKAVTASSSKKFSIPGFE